MHMVFDPRMSPSQPISFEEFLKVDIRMGTVLECEPFPEAKKPSYKLKIDFGEGVGVKKSSAQITANYDGASLVGQQVAAVVNFPPRQVGKFMSEVLVLGFADAQGEIRLVSVEGPVPNGARLS